jgi:superfamily I DNA/RNA helicase
MAANDRELPSPRLAAGAHRAVSVLPTGRSPRGGNRAALIALGNELAAHGDATEALKHLSEIDAVRILTIHKCKGLEFETVVVLGVEEELFWGDAAAEEFFVAISRAKTELLLTWADYRTRPSTPVKRWDERRTPHRRFLAYAEGD